jgi:hypothetical protein
MISKKILVAVDSISDAFESKLTNKSNELFYIKTSDLKDWAEDQSQFITKTFGDKLNDIVVNFIHKDGDKEFESDNLILEIKKFLFIKSLSKHN